MIIMKISTFPYLEKQTKMNNNNKNLASKGAYESSNRTTMTTRHIQLSQTSGKRKQAGNKGMHVERGHATKLTPNRRGAHSRPSSTPLSHTHTHTTYTHTIHTHTTYTHTHYTHIHTHHACKHTNINTERERERERERGGPTYTQGRRKEKPSSMLAQREIGSGSHTYRPCNRKQQIFSGLGCLGVGPRKRNSNDAIGRGPASSVRYLESEINYAVSLIIVAVCYVRWYSEQPALHTHLLVAFIYTSVMSAQIKLTLQPDKNTDCKLHSKK